MRMVEGNFTLLIRIAWLGAIVVLSLCGAPGLAATIPRSADVEASLAAFWSMLRASDAARNWLAPFNIRAAHQIFAPL